MLSSEIRERFMGFFEKHGHQRVSSSSLIPANDPTLLFANAGMNQFKDAFLGHEKRAYQTATSSQKCVRAGGKQNDLDNVGYTARHHTFFEMLGNFSFGDYFKQRAIDLAWTFLTKELGISPDRLYVTVYEEDDEALEIWRDQIGVPSDRIFRFGKKDNFWAMGDTGPCGPCSEIFYDYGDAVPGPSDPYEAIDSGSDKIIEVWNLVFMQYDRQEDGSILPLPNPSIDTGMGLERIASVMQGKTSNYDTDLFADIMQPVATYLGMTLGQDPALDTAIRVISDHLRAMAFLIADGVVPTSEGRGYVLRRIMRRAMRYGKQMGQTKPFLCELTQHVVAKMGDIYPELLKEQDQIKLLIEVDEKQFDKTLSRCLPIFVRYLDQFAAKGVTEVPGQVSFTMYDTYGFPLDLMRDIARGRNMTVADPEVQEQRETDRPAAVQINLLLVEDSKTLTTEMTCYDGLKGSGAVRRILVGEEGRDRLEVGTEARIVLDRTPFYAESGGQIGDKGTIRTQGGVFQVEDTHKVLDKLVLHHGKLIEGHITVGESCETEVLAAERGATMKNHTATHILHQALRDVLGVHVRQAGSLVDPDKLRFDFSHFAPLSHDDILQVENEVNSRILANLAVETRVMGREEAGNSGAIAFFGEKYGAEVRVVGVGDYSKEFCGGTHVAATGEIGCFKVISERGLATGIRRMVALTGPRAMERFQESEGLLKTAQERFSLARDGFVDQIQKLQDDRKSLERKVEELKMQLAKGGGSDERIEKIGELTILIKKVTDVSGGQMRQLADELLDKVGTGAVLLGSQVGDKAQLLVKTNTKDIHAGKLVGAMAEVIGGRGGGRPDMAMAGGKDVTKLGDALEKGLALIADS